MLNLTKLGPSKREAVSLTILLRYCTVKEILFLFCTVKILKVRIVKEISILFCTMKILKVPIPIG